MAEDYEAIRESIERLNRIAKRERRQVVAAGRFVDQFDSPADALMGLARYLGMAVHYLDRGCFDNALDRELTDDEWIEVQSRLGEYDKWLDNSGAQPSIQEWMSKVLSEEGIEE